jgi:aminopeptidase N
VIRSGSLAACSQARGGGGTAAPGIVTALKQGGGGGAIGAPGVGDPLFPLGGNGGYDVRHYALQLGYDPATTVLDGTALIIASATEDLGRFDLDLRGFTVSGVRVDGRPAAFTRDGQELQITPVRALRAGSSFAVTVRYSGTPEVIVDPDGSIEGWVPTADGAFVVGEPQGAPGWFPANDNPQDKATYDVAVTVPSGLTAVSNGVLLGQLTRKGRTTFLWHESSPMATYLATATLGRFDVARSRIGSVPSYVAVDPSQAADAAPVLAQLPEIVDFFTSTYGRYPFDAVAAIVDDAPDYYYANFPADDPLWSPPSGAVADAADLFSNSVYVRGAMTLQALRGKVGDAPFFRILRRWYAEHRDGNVTTADFIALAQRESGQDLRAFFDAWLYQQGRPASW